MLSITLSAPGLVVGVGRAPVARSSVVSMNGQAPDVMAKYTALELPSNKIQAEYLWIDAVGEVRSKARTIETKPGGVKVSDLPDWNYDGSSTDQAPGEDSEVLIKPRAIFKDPFRGGNNILVLTDTYTPAGEPLPTNTRAKAAAIFEESRVKAEEPIFGLEQEYTLFNLDKTTPLGWPVNGYPGPQGPYYCGAGADRSFGRDVCEAHYKACLFAGIDVSGINAEVMPGQWEFQVGPVAGIAAADQMYAARYILQRVCEDFGVYCTLDPKPIPGDWNGAGCHTNVSTNDMRAPGGYSVILKAMQRLGAPGKQEEHIQAYDISGGEDNKRRLTGAHETAPITKFSFGVANRGCSVRIPRMTEKEKKGYFEDRRPASNMDPYVVTGKIMETCILPDFAHKLSVAAASAPAKGKAGAPAAVAA